MKTINTIIVTLILAASICLAEVADVSIENERVESGVFLFEITIQRADAWAGDGLGHADFYFSYNDAGLSTLVNVTNLHPAISGNTSYQVSATINGGLLHVKIEYSNSGSIAWLPALNLAEQICTVEMEILDGSQNSEIDWDTINTGVLTTDLTPVQETFQGSGDISLPVELSAFLGRYVNGVVELSWRTESEFQNWGFHVYRSETNDGPFERINSALIKGAGYSTMPRDYHYVDERVKENFTYFYLLEDVDVNGRAQQSAPIRVQTAGSAVVSARDYRLEQNYPNPFNPHTTIAFTLEQAEDIELSIYHIDGRFVKMIAGGAFEAGNHSVVWDGLNQSGQRVPSGSYLYQLKTRHFQQSKKLILLR